MDAFVADIGIDYAAGPSQQQANGAHLMSSSYYSHEYSVRPLASKTDIPIAPKKPASAFILYFMEERPRLAMQNPQMRVTELTKRAGAMWKALDAEVKQKYNQIYKEALEKYDREHSQYLSSLTAEQHRALENRPLEKKLLQAKRKLAALERSLEKPRSPVNPYTIYVREVSSGGKVGRIPLIDIAAMWRALPKEDKLRYEEQFAREREEYTRQMEAWNNNVKSKEVMALKEKIHRLKAELAYKK